MKKIKLATQDRSKHCSWYKCPYPSVITVIVEKKPRRMCQLHYDQLMRHGLKYDVVFQKANSILETNHD